MLTTIPIADMTTIHFAGEEAPNAHPWTDGHPACTYTVDTDGSVQALDANPYG